MMESVVTSTSGNGTSGSGGGRANAKDVISKYSNTNSYLITKTTSPTDSDNNSRILKGALTGHHHNPSNSNKVPSSFKTMTNQGQNPNQVPNGQIQYHHQGLQERQVSQVSQVHQFHSLQNQVGLLEISNLQLDPDPIPFSQEELRRMILTEYIGRHMPLDQINIEDEELIRKALFDFVLHVPIWVDGHEVSRRAWAKAFYETDVINSAKCLFEALFTKKEMSNCTLNGKNGTEELSAVKMLAILRASCWMKNKEQDPYSFNPDFPAHNVHPSKEEQDKIEKKVFTERRSQANRKFRKRSYKTSDGKKIPVLLEDDDSDSQNTDNDNNNYFDSDSTRSEAGSPGNGFSFYSYKSSTTSGSVGGSSVSSGSPSHDSTSGSISVSNPIKKYKDLEEYFYRSPEEFVTRLLPTWMENYIFIDGILVLKSTWKQAFSEASDTVKAAWTLFQSLFSNEEIMNCTLNGKNGTTELCPVKKLAIIRAVQWMHQNCHDPSFSAHFDNDEDRCNLFPTKEDKEKIETKVFTEKRYQQSRQLSSRSNKNI